jgi:chromosome segregation ATPase
MPPADEGEPALRRQLSRLTRQLADAQGELANKDDELASEIEKRLELVATYDALAEEHRAALARVSELEAYEAKTSGMEQRIQEANTATEEMAQFLEREREARIAAQAKIDEQQRAFDETRELWNSERQMIEERTQQEVSQLVAQRKNALESTEQAHAAAVARLSESHAEEIARLKEGHERSLAALRGELEPRALEARSLAEERERLEAKIKALEAESQREREAAKEAHERDKQQASEAYAVEQAAAARAHASELAKAGAESGAQILSLQQSLRSSEALSKGLEEGIATLRDAHAKTQRELTEAKERIAQLETDVKSLEDRLVGAMADADRLADEKRVLLEQLDATIAESRRNALDRMRFVSYLEEGLALLGALPPQLPEPPEIEMSNDEPPSDS